MLPGLFDTHAHFAVDSAAEVLQRAKLANMAAVTAVGADERANRGALAAAAASLANPSPSFSLHLALGFDYSSGLLPSSAASSLAALRDSAPLPLSAIGEIGLDHTHGSPDSFPAQCALFERQVALAAEWNLPIIVHCREAEDDTLRILQADGSKSLAAIGRLGILHCFVGSSSFAQEILALGMMISFSGIVTFRNAAPLREVAKTIPSDRLLIETDSPYLAPVPLRGKINEPAFVEHTLRALAALRNEDPLALAATTTANANTLFGLPQ